MCGALPLTPEVAQFSVWYSRIRIRCWLVWKYTCISKWIVDFCFWKCTISCVFRNASVLEFLSIYGVCVFGNVWFRCMRKFNGLSVFQNVLLFVLFLCFGMYQGWRVWKCCVSGIFGTVPVSAFVRPVCLGFYLLYTSWALFRNALCFWKWVGLD